MPDHVRPLLGRLVVTPLVTVGVLAAILLWELEHVGTVRLAIGIAAAAVAVGVIVARDGRRRIEELSAHYESLLRVADEQSRRAEAANRAKDEFLLTLSHELRTPLNSILGWTRLLASGKLDPEHGANALRAIERAGWAQARLIDDLLDVSRIVDGKLRITTQPTEVPPIVDTVVRTLKPAADAKKIAVQTSIDRTIGPIAADRDRLHQIVWNLLSNAIKFTPEGGKAEVELSRAAAHVVISVRDTGVGFKPGTAEHLFERFRQGDSSTTRQHGGLGLGLQIVRHLVELHGGTVTARSPGEDLGAEFTVSLPLRPASNAVSAAPATRQQPLLRGIRVLVVDDDVQTLEMVRSALERCGAAVTTANSAREARQRFQHEPPDVLISDLRMPGEDGLQLIRDIRELDASRGRLTPAAALTALARVDDRRRALLAGYQMHMTKPVDPVELASAVDRLTRENSAGEPLQ